MSFLGGAECSTAGNPLTQFTKHVQDDKSLQRDRLVGRGPGGMQESMRSRLVVGGQDQMMDEFIQQPGVIPHEIPQPFAMEQMRRELESLQAAPARTSSPAWAAEFNPDEQAHMEAAFHSSKASPAAFSPVEFTRFQPQSLAGMPQTSSPIISNPLPMMAGFQRPMGIGYMGMGLMSSAYNPVAIQQRAVDMSTQDKGKRRMVELDDQNWEAQFAEMDAAQTVLNDDEANAAIEAELNDFDRKLVGEDLKFDGSPNLRFSDFSNWDGFDALPSSVRDPQFGDYLFEEDNAFRVVNNPFEEGMKIMREGGNLSLAALAFEAVQKEPQHIQAWTMLGSTQAQNEKETPAIRALEQALKLDPNNLDALMGLAVSYTNEGYDSTAYRTLERWLSVKYPQIVNPENVTPDVDVSFTDRQILHEKVTSLFIQAAQLSPSGEQMDPDVQVGLGVLFYCADEYDKAVDCFSAALASTESGTSTRKDQVHLLWNRLGATLANSGRSEEAIEAYEKALTINPNFVRARYNLGVSCINIGCYPEAAQHLLGALAMHRIVEEKSRERAREIIGEVDGIGDQELERMIHISQNQSTNLYDTLRRVFSLMGRRDLADMVVAGMDVSDFRKELDF
jgi:peroxin-5